MSGTAAQNAIAVVGVDIGKNSFHVVGLDDRGAIVLRQKWSRSQVEARFANIWGQALSDHPPPLQCRCHSRARASLRNRHQGPSIMGFENEVEQSIRRPYRYRLTAGSSGHANSPHPSSREGHHSTLGGSRVFSYYV